MKKIYTILSLSACVILLQSGITSSYKPPTGYTGATGSNCRSCHGSYALNSGGGVTVTGLPTGSYEAGTSYPFSINISHTTADRKRWGFAIKAVNSSGASVGTFTSSNSNAASNGSEMSHLNAPITTASGSYTFNNLTWKAPATGSANVTFYYVAVAANNASQDNGDYVYTGSSMVTLPVKLESFSASNEGNAVLLNWKTASESNSNYFEVERSDDGQFFFSVGKVNANTNSTSISSYSFADNKAASSGGNIFYRLKMTDKDGSARYSGIVSVKPHNHAVVISKVYPTIIHGGETIKAEIESDQTKVLYLSVLDAAGKVYAKQTLSLNRGDNNLTLLTPAGLPKGMIFLKFESNNFRQTESLIVQ